MLYKKLVVLYISFSLCSLFSIGQTYQYFTLDSALSLNCEQFGIETNGKSDNIKMAVLGPYKVSNVEKMDSGKYSTKTKLGKEISYGSDDGLEEFKVRKFESHAYYRMDMGKDADTASCFFSYLSSYNKKSETVLSSIFSKKEETSSPEYTDKDRLLQGTIAVMNDQDMWRFKLHYPPSGFGGINRSIEGYLTDGRDSLRIDFVYADIIKISKKDASQEKLIMRSPRGYSLVDFENRQVAALIFKQSMSYLGAKKLGNFTGDELGIIGNDNRKSAKLAIAALFSIMVGIQ